MIKKTLVVAILFSQQAFAIDIIPSNSGDYYRLGGGSNISMPAITNQQKITIGGEINTNLGYSCTGFNPAISITNTLNNMKESIQGIQDNLLQSATSAIGTLPMYLLKKANPDAYNMLQNTFSHAMDTFNIKMKSCQDGLNDINKGKSPYQDWFSISDSQGWLEASKRAEAGDDVDINQTQKELTKDPGKYGVPWIHEGKNSGGTVGDQVPINVVNDVVVAGMNVMLDPNRPLDSETVAPKDTELHRYWKTPKEAGAWSQLVLGDISISAKTNNDKTHAGVGLVTLLKKCPPLARNELTCANDIADKLRDIVSSQGYPSAAELKTVSVNDMVISPEVIFAIRNLSKEGQAVALSKLSQDVALQNLVDQALLLRRILIAGTQTKPVHNLTPALDMVKTVVADLDQDIKHLLFVHDIKQRLMTNTIQTLLAHEERLQAQSMMRNEATQTPAMNNGAVYKSES